jgi:hypothetical protein
MEHVEAGGPRPPDRFDGDGPPVDRARPAEIPNPRRAVLRSFEADRGSMACGREVAAIADGMPVPDDGPGEVPALVEKGEVYAIAAIVGAEAGDGPGGVHAASKALLTFEEAWELAGDQQRGEIRGAQRAITNGLLGHEVLRESIRSDPTSAAVRDIEALRGGIERTLGPKRFEELLRDVDAAGSQYQANKAYERARSHLDADQSPRDPLDEHLGAWNGARLDLARARAELRLNASDGPEEAEWFCNQAIRVLSEREQEGSLAEAYRRLADARERRNDFNRANEHRGKAEELKARVEAGLDERFPT